ncbi:MAG: Calx-beta domain-containing protein [Luteolibacter sp.]|uniref:Calx-beta domain-containing protein n=1 Tax=Luteolibacter sp. TaxID=1962973 RepID=UPI0032636000
MNSISLKIAFNHRLARIAVLMTVSLATLSAATLNKPVMYVTQVPIPDERLDKNITLSEMNITTTMMSPLADPKAAPRGGALWIRYADGSTVNLTELAGYGGPVDAHHNAIGPQGANSIAVMKPAMHWSGSKAIFAMVVGAPASASDPTVFHWQLYEITNFGQGQTPVISIVAGQPSNYNNFHACYDTQDRIIFVSDAPRGMQANLYPQLDEYMSLPCSTGLWRLDRTINELKQIIHTPSGAQSPFIDSAGRVIFVQWDHFTRDPQASTDRQPVAGNGDNWVQTFNGSGIFNTETPGGAFTLGNIPGASIPSNFASYSAQNTYPEPRNFDKTALSGTNMNGNALNQFFPWECREDGSSHEVANHAGRHEISSSVGPSFNDDLNLVTLNNSGKPTGLNFMQLTESPVTPGLFFAVNAVEFGTHAAGPIVTYQMADGVNPDTLALKYITPVASPPNPLLQAELAAPGIDTFRNPTPLTDNTLLVVTTKATRFDGNLSTAATPKSRYAFRLRMMNQSTSGGVTTYSLDSAFAPTSQSNVNISYYSGGQPVSYQWPLWELDPVEVVARANKPAQLGTTIPSVEQSVFDEVGVHAPTLQNYLRSKNLALLVNRDSTRRDSADKQQPYNLKVAWSNTQTLGAVIPTVPQKIYDIGWMQFIQADGLRGYTLDGNNASALPVPGRRMMPVPMHDTAAIAENPPVAGAPAGAVKLGNDGSWAAVLPAGRAMSWHLTDTAGTKSQVKERYWVTFAPGEVRTCAVCHGVNTKDQAGNLGVPLSKPQALYTMLNYWKSANPPGTLQHAATNTSVIKSAGSVTLHVNRTGGSTGPASVNYTTTDGSALSGIDYDSVSGILNWLDGDSSPKPVTIALRNPTTIGASKQLTVALSSPLYGALGNPASASVTVDEPPFQAWLFNKLGASANTPVGLPSADPDDDGMVNLLEWALNGDPSVSSQTQQPTASLQNNQLTISFTRNLSSTAKSIVEVSDDLQSWTAGSTYSPAGNTLDTPATTDITPPGSPAGFTVVKDNAVQAPGTRRFIHVRVEGP